MTKKVKLPKAVCDALNSMREYLYDAEIAYSVFRKEEDTFDTKTLLGMDSDTIMRALVLGYEPELIAEEQLKNLCFLSHKYHKDFDAGFERGAYVALKIHGIQYNWLNEKFKDDEI